MNDHNHDKDYAFIKMLFPDPFGSVNKLMNNRKGE